MSVPRILVATVNRSFLANAQDALAAWPGEAIVAATVADAVDRALETRIDLVMTDVGLPTEGGLALARMLSREPSTLDVPIVMACAMEHEASALGAGATLFVDPTPSRDEILDVLELLRAPAGPALRAAIVPLRKGKLAVAESGLSEAAALASGTRLAHWPHYFAAQAALSRGDRQAAFEELDALAADHPHFWRAGVRLALLLLEAGNRSAAEARYRRAMEGREDGAPALDALRASGREMVTGGTSGDEEKGFALGGGAAPRPTAAAPPARGGAATTHAAARSASILVADDSDLAIDVLKEVLQGSGFTVRVARDGREAVTMARVQRPDLVILDGLMPGMNGFEACKQIKAEPNPPPVVILSAVYTKQRQKWEAKNVYKADEVISKPFDDAELVATVRRLLGKA